MVLDYRMKEKQLPIFFKAYCHACYCNQRPTCSMDSSLLAAPDTSLIWSANWSKPRSMIFSRVKSSAKDFVGK